MLGPILQALWQQIGPAVEQVVNSALPYLSRVPPPVYINAAKAVSNEVSDWYYSLDEETRGKVDQAITWVVKDLACDVAYTYTGIRLNALVDKALELAEQRKDDDRARTYVTKEISRRVERPPLPEGCDLSNIGDKDPCPCGSGKRYENCHGFVK